VDTIVDRLQRLEWRPDRMHYGPLVFRLEHHRSSSWDLGEEAKIVVFSVTEGEDKPLKYPKMFREARYAVLSKIDLLPHVPFDVERALNFARRINPTLEFFQTSGLTGRGLDSWFSFLRTHAHGPAAV
jgi:hydrogenase nickel incorporation protein HypB